jgi:hypothetical protein
VEQQVEVLQSHNKWLEEELANKTDAMQQERRTVTAQVLWPMAALQHVLGNLTFH